MLETALRQRIRLSPLADAAIALLAADPSLGLRLTARPGPMREAFLSALGAQKSWSGARPMPAGTGRATSPLLASQAGDVTRASRPASIVAGAERMSPSDAAGLIERLGDRHPVVALDEGLTSEESPPAALTDRLGLWLDLGRPAEDREFGGETPSEVQTPVSPASVDVSEAAIAALCETAAAFGIASLRAPLFALRVARLSAALAGRSAVADEDILLAARLVLAPRAIQVPSTGETAADEPEEEEEDADQQADRTDPPQTNGSDDPAGQTEPSQNDNDRSGDSSEASGTPDAENGMTVEIGDAAISADLLKRLAETASASHMRGAGASRAGARASSGARRGRPVGSRAGRADQGPLDMAGTLTAALPWQRLRRQRFERLAGRKLILLPDDIRIRRMRVKRETATIFAVDASGSAALARLAEAKGAVERILAECYRRRDRVALLAFRGTDAELLLPETRSLTRARRALADLRAGGGTPLAAGIALARRLAEQCERQGRTPLLVFLTDGRANIGKGGLAGRAEARSDASAEARSCRGAGLASLVIDLSARPGQAARDLASDLGGRYLALPQADAAGLADAIAHDASKAVTR
ncbi:protoporphyrin IX magnesium-chelatase [Fulvimarina manganoxydans]|uniref:Protoporphyrin IX magnesium-chelatase n=1 Tax=Fulvimarina manganoxydans TaxID=937218 RepID=A0A1W2ENE6_9HYPH|nr:VWA domain-containing protein [Fulvimarina manganoxydans]SMD11199.1 protoporphyrin IX magnesium-chelatase [Fulvimarina manganoxydans]